MGKYLKKIENIESLKNVKLEIWKVWKKIIEIRGEAFKGGTNVKTRKGIQWNKYNYNYKLFGLMHLLLDSICLLNYFLAQKLPCAGLNHTEISRSQFKSFKVASFLRATVLPCATCRRYKELIIFQKKSYFL